MNFWLPSRFRKGWVISLQNKQFDLLFDPDNKHFDIQHHELRMPREEITFTARPKIQSQSQIFRYGGSLFCLPHRPNFSDIFDLCLHWMSVVRA